jgi:hypothetical protein
MKKIIRLTESELVGLIKKIIKEEKYSEEDLKYFHPEIGKECKIKIAKNKHRASRSEEFKPVLVCDMYDTGNEVIVAEVSYSAKSVEEVKDFICDNYEMVVKDLDSMFDEEEQETIMEAVDSRRWEIIDEPIVCDSFDFEM